MATAGWVVENVSATAVTTAKTALLLTASANRILTVVEFGVSFDGVTASAVPVLVETVSGTAATAGTSTAATAVQIRGRPIAVGATAGVNYTAEPTVLTRQKSWLVTPNGGVLVVQFPLGREPECEATTLKTWGIRITAPATVNYRCYAEFEQA